MNRAIIRRLAEHINAEHVEVHAHDYIELPNNMWVKLGFSWRVPSRLVSGQVMTIEN
ncbi:hypothetical protein L21SP5_01428 [Salinivirga cyanobacteriivorans]|uniref:Uncharacterized protein n=1 Tax=Salinivirga cyanobacteriivorans TaxID=1307839 RepID=A0A0S2HYL5_9BACT|nr:hypothetical protein [Salinivirga cyanobacteriivorans]ALO15078.1 hypothetical protein L21SP5_01428 [Salinivirga cyanobacteriivorans]